MKYLSLLGLMLLLVCCTNRSHGKGIPDWRFLLHLRFLVAAFAAIWSGWKVQTTYWETR